MNINKINKDGWNELVSSGVNFSNTSLPEYGPFMENENKLHLLDNIVGSKVLEFGCAKGDSLKYLKNKGASEVWGIDISNEQIKQAKLNGISDSNLFVGEMDNNYDIPASYFDYVLSLYSIGYSADIKHTFENAYRYLNKNGRLIICWTHPFFNCLGIEDDKVVVSKSYNDEATKIITKGPNKVSMAQTNYKISTLINSLIESGFIINKVMEENPIVDNNIGDYISDYLDSRKLVAAPTTLIIVASKGE